jgi:hypothetical protein
MSQIDNKRSNSNTDDEHEAKRIAFDVKKEEEDALQKSMSEEEENDKASAKEDKLKREKNIVINMKSQGLVSTEEYTVAFGEVTEVNSFVEELLIARNERGTDCLEIAMAVWASNFGTKKYFKDIDFILEKTVLTAEDMKVEIKNGIRKNLLYVNFQGDDDRVRMFTTALVEMHKKGLI